MRIEEGKILRRIADALEELVSLEKNKRNQ